MGVTGSVLSPWTQRGPFMARVSYEKYFHCKMQLQFVLSQLIAIGDKSQDPEDPGT